MFDLLLFVFYLIALGFTTCLFVVVASRRYGEHLATDPVTWVVCLVLAGAALVGGVQFLAWTTGHLSGRL